MNARKMTFNEVLRLLGPLFGVIFAVWFLRLILAAAGAPSWLVISLSVTGATPVCILIAVLLIHLKRAGGYGLVALASVLLAGAGQLLVVLALAFAMATGLENVYSAADFSPPHLSLLNHLCAHLFGIILFALLGTIMASFFLLLLRVLMPGRDVSPILRK